MQYEALFKVSNLLDQFREGLKRMDVLSVIQCFPQLFVNLFTFTGQVSSDDVLEAIFVGDYDVTDEILKGLLFKYIKNLSEEGMCMLLAGTAYKSGFHTGFSAWEGKLSAGFGAILSQNFWPQLLIYWGGGGGGIPVPPPPPR